MSDSTTVMVGGATVALTLPASYSIRYEVLLAYSTHRMRAITAALGLCWPRRAPGAPRAKYETSFSPLIYGGEIMDELSARGCTPDEILSAAVTAFDFLTSEFVPKEAEVKAAEDFSEAPEEPSTTP